MTELESYIKTVLNLRTNDSIGAELADRQLEVIIKSYLFLSKPNNNIIYIADEVGLGKTYIAAGIAMLFRHFNKNHHDHKDLIIVPKKNLQEKWKKELRNFVTYNYLSNNDTIREQYNFNDSIKNQIVPVKETDPITIFRMTSFSNIAASRNRKSELFNYLIVEIFGNDELAESVINKAWRLGYFNKGFENHLRKTVSYLLNALSSKIDCLMIDEAHNYKYGIGGEDYDESIRNETTARFLGAVKDNSILREFPKLDSRVKFPLSDKIICLSATPKDRSLMELRNQFNCFSNNHVLSEVKTPVDIIPHLKKFLIRGNLEYKLNGDSVSRNQCRMEHRLGNINKSETPIKLVVEDSFESVFWQLLQYKSIKHLDQKNNASFEIGMLAGFESYTTDIEKKDFTTIENQNEKETDTNEQKEYEQTAHRNKKESHDINIIRGIVASYYEEHNEFPPHPKQTKLENEIIDQLLRQEKSLIFVRRIATADELKNRIIEKYEREIVVERLLKFSGRFVKYKTQEVNELVEAYNDASKNKKIVEKLDKLLTRLLTKDEIRATIINQIESVSFSLESDGLIWLKIAYDLLANLEFKLALNEFITRDLSNVSGGLKLKTIDALKKSYKKFKEQSESDTDIVDIEKEEPQSGYFFLDYFKKGRVGFPYRQKMYRENWYEINPILLNNQFRFVNYDIDALNNQLSKVKDKDKKKNQVFNTSNDLVLDYFSDNGKIISASETSHSNIFGILNETTFMTKLICEYCHLEMSEWISKRIKFKHQNELTQDLRILNSMLRNIFRNGSGLLPGFIAGSMVIDFEKSLLELIANADSQFYYVLNEIKTIIKDFDLLITTNFQERKEDRINVVLRNLTPIVGTSGEDKRDRGILASQFRMPGFPYVLITTDIFREGEDLHTYCQNIYHYGIAWNPSDMEQRTGRIDRINSLSYRKLNKTQQLNFNNKVQVFYPYLIHSVEVNQVIELLVNLNKFIETFNDINLENYYKSKVNINEEYTQANIPLPITDRLRSIYDVHEFTID